MTKKQRNWLAVARAWIILITGMILIVYSLQSKTSPAALMIGCSMVGGVPLDVAFTGSPKAKS